MNELISSNLFGSSDFSWDVLNYEFFQNFESFHTRKCYERDIQLFFDFLKINHIKLSSIKDIKKVHIIAYKNFLQEKQQAPKTICRKLSSLSSYFDFLVEKDIVEINCCQGVKRPRQIVVNETKDLSDKSVQKLFDALFDDEETPSVFLHRAVIFLLFSTGVRKAELINLKVNDYQQASDSTYCLKIKAKGGKYLIKVLHPSAKMVLDQYLHFLCESGDIISGDEYLLRPTKNPKDPKNLNKPINPKSIDYILRKYCQKAGIFERISPHSARATYIGSALENGVELWRVSLDVGHESVRTTEIYNKRRSNIKNSPVHSLGFFKPFKKSA